MPYLIEILLPISESTTRTALGDIRSELTEHFGGVTVHANAPADGLWDDGQSVEQDRIVVVEVMADKLDREWWAGYRTKLEGMLAQKEIVLRAISIERL